MSEHTKLEDLLNDDAQDRAALNDTPEPVIEDAPTSEAAPSDEGVSADENAADATGDDDDAPPASRGGKQVPLSALQSEREARREHEKRARDLEAELAAYKVAQRQPQRQQQQPQPKPPNAWDDPDAAIQYAVRQANEQAAQRQAAMSEEIAKATFPDYDEVIQGLGAAVQVNPALANEIWSSPAPAIAAYRAAKRHQAMSEIGPDPSAYRERIRQEILAEMQITDPRPKGANAPRLPKSMASGASVGKRSGPAWSGARPLTDILNE